MKQTLVERAVGRCVALAAIAAALSLSAPAATIINLGLVDTGTPSGVAPYLTATITNTQQDEVLMVLTAPGLKYAGGIKEFVSQWAFNVDPGLQSIFGTATFAVQPQTTLTANSWGILTGLNSLSAPPSTGYDLKFTFSSSNAGGGAARFEQPDLFAVKIGLLGINENSFLFQNTTGSGQIAYSYAHIQAGEAGGSSKVYAGGRDCCTFPQEVPEPSTYAMMAGGLGILVAARRFKH